MEKIIQVQNIISAIIGFGSALIVAILTGIFQIKIAKRNGEIQEKQLEESRKQFLAQIEQAQKENDRKIAQLQEEQRNANIERAKDKLQLETKRFYDEILKEMAFYERMVNELHYLSNIANPKYKELRFITAYPHIDNNIKELIGDVSLHQNIAPLLGALRANISLYNVALDQGAASDVLEKALKKVYDLIAPINEEGFKNYTNAQKSLSKYEKDTAKKIIDENSK